uniref:Uncharacterized protein n=1 Tax=Anguilla anguilla TaxID=7936 RepID=A0A0E9XY08_ANGAN
MYTFQACTFFKTYSSFNRKAQL